MSCGETRRHEDSHKSHTSFFCTLRGLPTYSDGGAVVCQVNFVNQICEVWSDMSDRFPSFVHHIKLVDGRCEHVIRFTYMMVVFLLDGV